MRASAHQIGYLGGYLGLVAKVASAEVFIHLDVVPIQGTCADAFESRNRIKTAQGEQWLSVPVHRGLDVPLKDVGIAGESKNWRRKHWRAIELAYARAPYFTRYAPALSSFYEQDWRSLSTMNLALAQWMYPELGVNTRIVLASELGAAGAKNELLIDLCRKVGATSFEFGKLGRGYADIPAFERAGVAVSFQDYKHPQYRQLHGGFTPYMSALDLLFNEGPKGGAIAVGA